MLGLRSGECLKDHGFEPTEQALGAMAVSFAMKLDELFTNHITAFEKWNAKNDVEAKRTSGCLILVCIILGILSLASCVSPHQHEKCDRCPLLEEKVRALEVKLKEAEETEEGAIAVVSALVTIDRLWGELRSAETDFFMSLMVGAVAYSEGTDQQYLSSIDNSLTKLDAFAKTVERIHTEISSYPKVGCESLKQIVVFHHNGLSQHRQTLMESRKMLPSLKRGGVAPVVPKAISPPAPAPEKEKSYVGGAKVKKPNWRALKKDLSPDAVIAFVGSPDQERYMTKEAKAMGVVKTLSGEPLKNQYVWKFRLPDRPDEEVIAIFSNDKLVSWGRRPASNSLDDITLEKGK